MPRPRHMSGYLDTRCITHPANPVLWVAQARLYGAVWSTICDGDVFECVRAANWLAGIGERSHP